MGPLAVNEPIRLNFGDKGRQVFVTTENEDRFMLSVQQAAKACQMADQAVRFSSQFRQLLGLLATWLRARKDKAAQAFVTIRDAGLLFLVVQKSRAFDPEFEAQLTELDLGVAQDRQLDLIRLNVLALPRSSEESYGSFLMPGQTWVFADAK